MVGFNLNKIKLNVSSFFFFYVNGDFVERSFELQILSDAQSLFFGVVREEA